MSSKNDIRKPQQEAQLQKAKTFYQELMDENVFERIATFAKISNYVYTHKEAHLREAGSERFIDPALNKEFRDLRLSLFDE